MWRNVCFLLAGMLMIMAEDGPPPIGRFRRETKVEGLEEEKGSGRSRRQTEVEGLEECKFNLEVTGLVNSCNWTVDVSQYQLYPWDFNIGINAHWRGGPTKDADNTRSGGYTFVDMSQFFERPKENFQQRAWLMTEVMQPTTARGKCIKFSYSLRGLNVEALRLIRIDIGKEYAENLDVEESSEFRSEDLEAKSIGNAIESTIGGKLGKLKATVVWSKHDSTNGAWMEGKITYASTNQHVFIFEATPTSADQEPYRGFVALDNYRVQDGPCDRDCNFDAMFDMCKWENANTDDFDWSVGRGSLKSFTGPTKDESTSSMQGKAGGYAYVDSAYPRRPGDLARLKTIDEITTEPDHPLCLVFYVNMFGSGIGSLSVIQDIATETDPTKKLTTLWEMVRPASSPRDLWHRAQVTISTQKPATLYFEATIGETGRGDIALDTVSFQKGPCVIKPNEAARFRSVGCSFNNDLCGYLSKNIPHTHEGQAEASPPLWSRVRGTSDRYPPGHDRIDSLNSGEEDWYALFDVRNYQHRPLDRGYLLGPQIPVSNDPLCVGFWVYMATSVASVPYLGTLRLLLIPRNATGNQLTVQEPSVLWSLTNQQEPAWMYSQVSFVPNAPYLLTFEGIRANNVLGTIAVDDVTIFPGACAAKPPKAVVDKRDCSFEFGFCSWRPVNPGSNLVSDLRLQDWKVADRNHNFGSFRDHTFNLDNSGYVYFDTINIPTKTWLVSAEVQPNQGFCLQFWYAAASSEGSNLIVKRQFTNGTMGEQWRVTFADLQMSSSSAVSKWQPVQVYLPPIDSISAIVFEGNSNNGGFALDDVQLTDLAVSGQCDTRPVFTRSASYTRAGSLFNFLSKREVEKKTMSVHQKTSQFHKSNIAALSHFRRGRLISSNDQQEILKKHE